MNNEVWKATEGHNLTFFRGKSKIPAKLNKNDMHNFEEKIREIPQIPGNF